MTKQSCAAHNKISDIWNSGISNKQQNSRVVQGNSKALTYVTFKLKSSSSSANLNLIPLTVLGNLYRRRHGAFQETQKAICFRHICQRSGLSRGSIVLRCLIIAILTNHTSLCRLERHWSRKSHRWVKRYVIVNHMQLILGNQHGGRGESMHHEGVVQSVWCVLHLQGCCFFFVLLFSLPVPEPFYKDNSTINGAFRSLQL